MPKILNSEDVYQFCLTNADISGGLPNFTEYKGQPLTLGCMAINADDPAKIFIYNGASWILI